MKIYFSAPLNTPYQREYVNALVETLRKEGFEVYLGNDQYIDYQSAFEEPAQADDKPLYADKDESGKLTKSDFAREVFTENYNELAQTDALVALLDGSQVDDRVACEIGVFYGLMRDDPEKKGILGFATDVRCLRRRDSTYGVNIFTVGTLEEVGKVFEDFDELMGKLKTWDK